MAIHGVIYEREGRMETSFFSLIITLFSEVDSKSISDSAHSLHHTLYHPSGQETNIRNIERKIESLEFRFYLYITNQPPLCK
jgi:hypothetical protein